MRRSSACAAVVMLFQLMEYVHMHCGKAGQGRKRMHVRPVFSKCRLQFSICHLLVATTLLAVVLPVAMTFVRRIMIDHQLRIQADRIEREFSQISTGSYDSGARDSGSTPDSDSGEFGSNSRLEQPEHDSN